ncbi:hypothetical protein ABT384_41545 [Streptomyces lanatus]|uniref:Lipoprotein n=2 Tax=Streptomyces lanatus TaxID=66900 RepID=A0ABV1Y608_9ACTN|nr:hypothetical protein [Streptomyces lanatus]
MSARRTRAAAVAVSLAGALALTACSGDGGSDDDSPSATPSPSATASADTGGATGGGSGSASGALEGSWLATTGGKAVILVVTGKQAALFETGGNVCNGTAAEESGMRMIRLKCTDGNKDRAAGMVDSAGKERLKVTWEGSLGAETFTKAEGGKLPTGLPTAGLGQ